MLKLVHKVALAICIGLIGFLGVQCDSAMPAEPQSKAQTDEQSEIQVLRQNLTAYTKSFVATSPVESRGLKSFFLRLSRALCIASADVGGFFSSWSFGAAADASNAMADIVDKLFTFKPGDGPNGPKSYFDFSAIEEESPLITGINIRQNGNNIDLGLREGALHNRIIVLARQIDPSGGRQSIISAIQQISGEIYTANDLAEHCLPDSIEVDEKKIFDYYQKKEGANQELYELVRGYFDDCKMIEDEVDFAAFTAGYLNVISNSDIDEDLKAETIRGVEFAFSSIMLWLHVQVDEGIEE